jgi:hypothetical protein
MRRRAVRPATGDPAGIAEGDENVVEGWGGLLPMMDSMP